jgi:hypothetical protein
MHKVVRNDWMLKVMKVLAFLEVLQQPWFQKITVILFYSLTAIISYLEDSSVAKHFKVCW